MLLEDIFTAYYDARRHKRNTKSQLLFEINLEDNLMSLYDEIAGKRYAVGPSTCFMTHVPVRREVFAAGFRDRVVHHLLYNYIGPLLERNFIYDAYSCRVGKGTLFGVQRLEHHIRSCSQNYTRPCYILKLDIQGYFMNINRDRLYQVLMDMLCKYEDSVTPGGAKWKDTYEYDCCMYLLPLIIYNNPVENCIRRGSARDWDGLPPSKSLFHSPEGCGLPIGNLTSQLFSNVYLNDMDQYVKRTLKCRHYGRYVDDFYLVHESKGYLMEQKKRIEVYLRDVCKLQLHPAKVYLQDYGKGVTYLGATVKPYRRYAGKRVVGNFKKLLSNWNARLAVVDAPGKPELQAMRASVNSYLGLLKHYRSYRLKKNIFGRPNRIFQYGYLTGGMNMYCLAHKYL